MMRTPWSDRVPGPRSLRIERRDVTRPVLKVSPNPDEVASSDRRPDIPSWCRQVEEDL
jgi:hypothetical protein